MNVKTKIGYKIDYNALYINIVYKFSIIDSLDKFS